MEEQLGLFGYTVTPVPSSGRNLAKLYKAQRHYRQKYPEKNREKARRYQQKYPERVREKNFKRKYGITLTEYEELLHSQNHCCALCLLPFGEGKKLSPHVDHDHHTKQVRGVLHSQCNLAIGNFNDDVTRLRQAIRYLQQEKEELLDTCMEG